MAPCTDASTEPDSKQNLCRPKTQLYSVYLEYWVTLRLTPCKEAESSSIQPPFLELICKHPYPWNVSKPWQQVPWLWCWQWQSLPLMLEVLGPKEPCEGSGWVQFLLLCMLPWCLPVSCKPCCGRQTWNPCSCSATSSKGHASLDFVWTSLPSCGSVDCDNQDSMYHLQSHNSVSSKVLVNILAADHANLIGPLAMAIACSRTVYLSFTLVQQCCLHLYCLLPAGKFSKGWYALHCLHHLPTPGWSGTVSLSESEAALHIWSQHRLAELQPLSKCRISQWLWSSFGCAAYKLRCIYSGSHHMAWFLGSHIL